jgi:dihydropteroate synthase
MNLTPDSFYDGGGIHGSEQAVARGLELAAQGADMVDVGGESTRPGAADVDEALELKRVLPVVAGLKQARPKLVLSVDTTKAAVAGDCLEAGADVINDVSACRFDPALVDVLVQYRPGYVLMHCQGRPRDMQKNPIYDDVVDEVRCFLEERMNVLVRAGLPEGHIILDPGIGFGKRLEHNLALLRGLHVLAELGRPLYIGISNKSLWGDLLGLALEQRRSATYTATALLAARGVAVHRVHDPEKARTALTLAANLWLDSPFQTPAGAA